RSVSSMPAPAGASAAGAARAARPSLAAGALPPPQAVARRASATKERSALFLADKVIVSALEEHVEGREAAVAAGDVLLQLHLLIGAQRRVLVQLLLEQPQLVADHDDLLEEDVDGHRLVLRALLAGAQEHLSTSPALPQLDVAHPELVEEDFTQHCTEFILVHIDPDLLRNGGARLGLGLLAV